MFTSAVYSPPHPRFPHLAVLFAPTGEVLVLRAVPSMEAGQRFIAEAACEIAEKHSLKITLEEI
jgi:hypothetical protein